MRKPLALLTLTCSLLVACSQDETPGDTTVANPGTPLASQTVKEDASQTLDDKFLKVASKIDDFGGMFFNQDGDLEVYVQPPTGGVFDAEDSNKKIRVKNAVTEVFGQEVLFKSNKKAASNLNSSASETVPAEVKLKEGAYSFKSLDYWYKRILSKVKFSEVVFTDIDESRNRITIAVSNDAEFSQVNQLLTSLGVPKNAVLLEIGKTPTPSATLQDYYRPIAGGLQIEFPGYVCTLGFNAYLNGTYGFVTNSHCSSRIASLDNVQYTQGYNAIGVETTDPIPFTNINGCPTNSNCRFSDANFASYIPGTFTNFGNLMVTNNRISPITIRDSGPFLAFTGKNYNLVMGQGVVRIGRTTGTTGGKITRTCYNTGSTGDTVVRLCQFGADYEANPGDSGSPVYETYTVIPVNPPGPSYNVVNLLGIHWGGAKSQNNIVFSPLSGIERDLGTLTIR
ncbi:hypothetical protein [Deinococcus planocerae]|uniref:hypothetical protein n=1 Tax=Deinococcus planocerae TaxID=1737569 RepID=UPI0011AF8E6C|nr:hypothetical protein [Deinococcus planocerae]